MTVIVKAEDGYIHESWPCNDQAEAERIARARRTEWNRDRSIFDPPVIVEVVP